MQLRVSGRPILQSKCRQFGAVYPTTRILSAAGGNEYQKHRGSRHQRSSVADDKFTRDVKLATIAAAEKKLAEMNLKLFEPAAAVESSSSESDDSSDSDSG